MTISKGTMWFAKGSLMAIAIYLGSTFLIQYALSPPVPAQGSAAPKKFKEPPANEARFKASFEAGKQALSEGRYATALDSFLEAERSVDQLTDDQYNALKQARLKIARVYESSGDSVATNDVYRALADCANRDGNALLKENDFDRALARGQDDEQFSDRLTEGKQDALYGATFVLAVSLQGLHRYPEAVLATQRYIDFLKQTADPYDQAFVQAYSLLEGIYAEAKDWRGVEQALVQLIDTCDTIHSRITTENVALSDQPVIRNWAQYNLVIAYYQEGNTDAALSKAEDFFTEYSQKEQATAHLYGVVYHANDFAALALQIAKESNRQDAINYWQKRTLGPNGGITTLALHPPATH
jgi:tetratricopeptide (TPR) repeat protein